jgi:ABC-2 type transport system ATP-binding protein
MITLENLQKTIEDKTVIDIPTLRVDKGEIAALVGPVGCGKGELFKLLIGKGLPTAGTIRLAGMDPYREKDRLYQVVGVLFSESTLYKYLSPASNLEFQAQLYRLPRYRVREVLSEVGLGDQANAKTEKLSTNLLRRLDFGRAIIHSPQILLLFEPFHHCNKTTIHLLNSLMRSLADNGKTVLILTGDPSHLDPLCDKIYYLDQGQIIDTRRPEDEQEPGFPFKIPARLEDKSVVLLNPPDILYAYANEGRSYLVTNKREFPTQFTLTELEERLIRSGFFRAHRGYLVNLQHVREVIPFTRNSFSLWLNDPAGTEIPLSKLSASELGDLLGY